MSEQWLEWLVTQEILAPTTQVIPDPALLIPRWRSGTLSQEVDCALKQRGPFDQVVGWGTTEALIEIESKYATGTRQMRLPDPRLVRLIDSKLTAKLLFGEALFRMTEVDGSLPVGIRPTPLSLPVLESQYLDPAAQAIMGNSGAAALKVDSGVGGWGTLALSTDGGVPSDELVEAGKSDSLIQMMPALVEDWIPHPHAMLVPTVDCIPSSDETGSTLLRYGEMFQDEGRYRGSVIYSDPIQATVPPQVQAVCERFASQVSRLVDSLGFSGWHDVDFLLDESLHVRPGEINARRTALTHLFSMGAWGSRRLGSAVSVASDDHFHVGEATTDFDAFLVHVTKLFPRFPALSPSLLTVPTMVRSIRNGYCGLVFVGELGGPNFGLIESLYQSFGANVPPSLALAANVT